MDLSDEEWINFRVPDVHPAVLVAANWWAKVIGENELDNGDSELTSQVKKIQAMFGPVNLYPVTNYQRAKFREILAFRLDNLLFDLEAGSIYLSVDYGPDPILHDSALAAGLGHPSPGAKREFRANVHLMMDLFPWKTNMNLQESCVCVSHGYAAPWEVLYEV